MRGQRKTAGLIPLIASLPLGAVTGHAFLHQRPQLPLALSPYCTLTGSSHSSVFSRPFQCRDSRLPAVASPLVFLQLL